MANKHTTGAGLLYALGFALPSLSKIAGVWFPGHLQQIAETTHELAEMLKNIAVVYGFAMAGDSGKKEDLTPPPTPRSSQSMKALMVLLVSFTLGLQFTGCTTSPQRAAFQTAGAIDVSVDSAMNVWRDYCKKFNPPRADRLKVKKLYERAQAAELAAIDAERLAVDVATKADAQAQASQTLADLVDVLRTFNLQL